MSVRASSARLATLLALTGMLLPGVPAGAGTAAGYVRVAHLSPDSPPVGIHLHAQSGVPGPAFSAVAYGTVSGYLRLPAGPYAIAVRNANAAPSDPPVLTSQITVTSGAAYTIAGVGRHAGLGVQVLQDDLRLPADGAAKVRVVQASVRTPVLDVVVADGPQLGRAVPFAATTGYRQVPPGLWTVQVRPPAGEPTTLSATLAAGSVYSLLVVDRPDGRLAAALHLDAGRRGSVPSGGVDAGAGGARPGHGQAVLPPLGVGLFVLLGVAALALSARLAWSAGRGRWAGRSDRRRRSR